MNVDLAKPAVVNALRKVLEALDASSPMKLTMASTNAHEHAIHLVWQLLNEPDSFKTEAA